MTGKIYLYYVNLRSEKRVFDKETSENNSIVETVKQTKTKRTKLLTSFEEGFIPLMESKLNKHQFEGNKISKGMKKMQV